jgi:hypothetical protein
VQQPFRLGDNYHVEPSLNRVTGPKGAARLEPKVMGVLVCLATRAGEMVPKDRLMGSVWADTAVGDDHAAACRRAPRQLVGCVKSRGFVTRIGIGVGRGGYYAPCGAGSQTSVHLLDPATGRDRVVANVGGLFLVNGLAVSPDGNTILRPSRRRD